MRTFISSFFITFVSASFFNHVDIVERASGVDVLTTGGWALALNNTIGCPKGNSLYSSNWCCPAMLDAVEVTSAPGNHACCPASNPNCLASIEAKPYCARLTWVLWNSTEQTIGNGYFCCPGANIGTNDMTCVPVGTEGLGAEGGRAQRLGRPLPPGVTITEGSGSKATTLAGPSSTTSTSTVSITSSSHSAATAGATGRVGFAGGAVGVMAGVMAIAAL